MELTREQAIENHRKLWTTTAVKFSIPLLMQGFQSVCLIDDQFLSITDEFNDTYMGILKEGQCK